MTYQVLPCSGSADITTIVPAAYAAGNAYSLLIDYLSCSGTANKNARNIAFMETPADYSTKGFVDPWLKTFGVGLDGDYNGTVTIGGTALKGSVFVWSAGPDAADNSGGNDDICSWKE